MDIVKYSFYHLLSYTHEKALDEGRICFLGNCPKDNYLSNLIERPVY